MKNKIIKISNELAQKLYIDNESDTLNTLQKAVICYLLSKIKANDNAIQKEYIQLKEICDLFNINYSGGKNRKNVLNSINELKNKKFYIYGENKAFYWIEEIHFSKNSEYIITINRELSKYLLNLKEKYTFFKLGYITDFKCQYSWRLFLFCHSWIEQQYIAISLEKAYLWFGCQKYKYYSTFVRRVIKPALEEINYFTDIHIKIFQSKNKKNIIFAIFKKPENIRLEIEESFFEEQELQYNEEEIVFFDEEQGSYLLS